VTSGGALRSRKHWNPAWSLNRGLVSDPAAPFGGVKQSGIGREGGHEGTLEFLESKYIAVDW
jgi:succinate-semialdehyde dehydrogenase / glutarate-semialdehyde dehydrogenase